MASDGSEWVGLINLKKAIRFESVEAILKNQISSQML